VPSADLTGRARSLRKRMTEAETRLWFALRRHALGGLRFRRQVPLGPYVVDFVCFPARIAVEIDGGQHTRAPDRRRDAERDAWLVAQGHEIMRFWNHDVLANLESVVQAIADAVEHRCASDTPSPNPLPRGEGALHSRRRS